MYKDIMDLFSTILILILLVSLSGIVVKLLPFQIPLPLMQIALGCILAAFHFYVEFDPELFLVLFIPPLLFADGRKTVLKDFIHNVREIVGLALVLVVITVIALGYLLYWILPVPGLSLAASLALAAVLSPTDAVALGGIVGQGRIEKSKMEIIEGEALMNDASGLVSLKFAILIAIGQMEFNLFEISASFFFVAIGGLAIGVLVTWIYTKLLRKVNLLTNNDPAIQIVLLFLLPFAVYLIAEHIGFSGILAAVSAGMTVKQSGIMRNAPLNIRLQSESTWSMLTFVFNGFVFILLGLQLPKIISDTYAVTNLDGSTIEIWQLCFIVILVYMALMGTRFLWLYAMKRLPVLPVILKKPLEFKNYSIRDLWISTFAGVRGAITLAGVLSIPVEITGRYELIFIATGVILVSLVVAVFVLPILLGGKVLLNNSQVDNEVLYAKGFMAEEAIGSLEKMQNSILADVTDGIDSEIVHEVGSRVIGSLRRRTGLKDLEQKALEAENLERRMRLVAIGSERAALYQLKIRNEISEETFERLGTGLDIYEAMLTGENK